MGNMFDLNPAKMQALMKQMGMSQENIDASKVTIEKNDGTNIVIENPHVVKINIQGKDSFQVSGDVRQESKKSQITEDDIKQVMEKTGKSIKKVKNKLKEVNGDIAEAILELGD